MARSIATSVQALPRWIPLPAGVWGVRCVTGPDWSDFPHTCTVGTVLNPEHFLKLWCEGVTGENLDIGGPCSRLASHHLGGWFIGRSAAVRWDDSDEVLFHRCGDDGQYDLAFHVNEDFGFDVAEYLRVEAAFHAQCRRMAPRTSSHIIHCETRRRCHGLARLLAGDDVRDALSIVLRHASIVRANARRRARRAHVARRARPARREARDV